MNEEAKNKQAELVREIIKVTGTDLQKVIADRIGFDQSQVSRLLAGDKIGRRLAIRIAAEMEWPLSKVFPALGVKPRPHDDLDEIPKKGAETGQASGGGVEEKPMPSLLETLRTFGTLIDSSGVRVLSTVPCGYDTGDLEDMGGQPLMRLAGYDYTLRAEGDSMWPMFTHGTVLFVQSTNGEPVLKEPNILLVNGEPTCAYVDVVEWGKYVLYKENGDYEERIVDAADCVFQGVVAYYLEQPETKERRKQTEGTN